MPHFDNSDPAREAQEEMSTMVGMVETAEGPIEVHWEAEMGFVALVTPVGPMMLNVSEAVQLETLLEKVRLANS